VVSFHGTLPIDDPPAPGAVKAQVLVLNGAADSYVSDEQLATFKDQMRSAGAQFKLIDYAGAKHSFTNPAADQVAREFDLDVAYDAQADRRSWQDMQDFFRRILGD
jgi:dienelactone hydrolase